jgi:DNA gyrase subunit A
VKLINIKGKDSIAAVTKVMKDDPADAELDADGNPIVVIERVKPVLEILEDEGVAEDDEDEEDDEDSDEIEEVEDEDEE